MVSDLRPEGGQNSGEKVFQGVPDNQHHGCLS